MLKIDFHIHTKATIKDEEFVFDLQTLNQYTSEKELDCIAITNHNYFDKMQFETISNTISCKVFPGMEIDIESAHLLMIGDIDKIEELEQSSNLISKKIIDQEDYITFEEFIKIFPNYKDYILIPHYMKKPKMSQSTIRKFSNLIKCGEVPNPKKFLSIIKDNNKLIPVVFSDYRPYIKNPFPNRYTYLDCVNNGFSNIRCAIEDRNKVSISKIKEKEEIEYLPDGSTISSKLNVILGTRTSGKTYNIEKIRDAFDFDNYLYVQQFSLIGDAEESKFNDLIKKECNDISEHFYGQFRPLVEKILSFDISQLELKIEEQLDGLIEYAKNADIDTYSQTKIFSENEFDVNTSEDSNKLIMALGDIYINKWNKEIVEKYITIDKLKQLIMELIQKHNEEKKLLKLKSSTNELVRIIKSNLTKASSTNAPATMDLINVFKNKKIIDKVNELFPIIKKQRKIKTQELSFFNVSINAKGYNNATELKDNLKSKASFKTLLDSYYKQNKLYDYIWALKNDGFNLNQICRSLFNISYDIKNAIGEAPSGGEKAEFNLLKEIDNANKYDILLIDEPEASFDNPFISHNIVDLIKNISKKTTVCISTHNSTLAMMLNPDKIIFTENNSGVHKVYYGRMGDKIFKSINGEEIISYDKILEVLEAGKEVYEEKGKKYESFRN